MQLNGHPFMKKVTLIPGPSWIEYLLTLKIRPFIIKGICFWIKNQKNGNLYSEDTE
jgi:hypothetical protein